MLAIIRALWRHPGLWIEGIRATFAMARRSWWRRFPFVPMPPAEYIAWRTQTAYGSADHPLAPADVVAFLEWRRRQRARPA